MFSLLHNFIRDENDVLTPGYASFQNWEVKEDLLARSFAPKTFSFDQSIRDNMEIGTVEVCVVCGDRASGTEFLLF